jgi:hypothetical protein
MNDKRYRIVSDGTPVGTKVYDTDGHQLDMGLITKVEWSVEASGIGVARLTLWDVEVDVAGDARAEAAQPSVARE